MKAVVSVQSNLEIPGSWWLPLSVCLANQTFLSLSCPRFLSHHLLLLPAVVIYFISTRTPLFCSLCGRDRWKVWPLTPSSHPKQYLVYLNLWFAWSISLLICFCACVRLVLSWSAPVENARQWWREYWSLSQAPAVSTRWEGDPSRPSYWHTELICSFWSIPANWNYHCTSSHVRFCLAISLLVLCVFVGVFMEV